MEKIEQVANLLNGAKRILIITGAGVSAESGIPTYRGIGGLYNDGGTEEGIPIEKALSIQMFWTHPEVCWKHIARVEEACRGAQHNRAHEIIAELQETAEVIILTQNVDGFHLDAGSENVIEIHGNVHRLLCTACDWDDWVEDYSELKIPPKCPNCKQLVRPDVVLFDENLPEAAVEKFYEEIAKGFDVVLSVGTTSVFLHIAGPVVLAKELGIPTVEINPDNTDISDIVDIRLKMRAVAAFETLLEKMSDETN